MMSIFVDCISLHNLVMFLGYVWFVFFSTQFTALLEVPEDIVVAPSLEMTDLTFLAHRD